MLSAAELLLTDFCLAHLSGNRTQFIVESSHMKYTCTKIEWSIWEDFMARAYRWCHCDERFAVFLFLCEHWEGFCQRFFYLVSMPIYFSCLCPPCLCLCVLLSDSETPGKQWCLMCWHGPLIHLITMSCVTFITRMPLHQSCNNCYTYYCYIL